MHISLIHFVIKQKIILVDFIGNVFMIKVQRRSLIKNDDLYLHQSGL